MLSGLIVQIWLYIPRLVLQLESIDDHRDDFGCEELSVGVDDEATCLSLVNDTAAWKLFIFVCGNCRRQALSCESRCAKLPPFFPDGIVTTRISQAISIGLCLVQSYTVGNQNGPAFVRNKPEYADLRCRGGRSGLACHLRIPLARMSRSRANEAQMPCKLSAKSSANCKSPARSTSSAKIEPLIAHLKPQKRSRTTASAS